MKPLSTLGSRTSRRNSLWRLVPDRLWPQRLLQLLGVAVLLPTALFLLGSFPANAQTPAGSIADVALASDEPQTLTITWDAASPTPAGYEVIWTEAEADLSWWLSTWPGRGSTTSTEYTVTELKESTVYKVRVRARYDDGVRRPWSDEKEIKVLWDPNGTAYVWRFGLTSFWEYHEVENSIQLTRRPRDLDPNTLDLAFRADVVDAGGRDSNFCEGTGTGVFQNRYIIDDMSQAFGFQYGRSCIADDYHIVYFFRDGQGTVLGTRHYNFVVRGQGSGYVGRMSKGIPTLSGEATVGQTLTVDASNVTSDYGLTNATFSYQWISTDGEVETEIVGATSASYTLAGTDEGKAVKVRVDFTDDEGESEYVVSFPTEVKPSSEDEESTEEENANSNSPASGAPTISGTAQVGQTLTASTSGISDSDGLDNATYSYQWLSSRDTEIDGATGSTYVLVGSDAGKTIKVRVTFIDDAGNAETLTSAATAAVAAGVPDAPGNLSVSVHDTGKLDVSWDAPDRDGGLPLTEYKVQWKESSNSWDTPADVSETTVTGTSSTVSGLTDGVGYAIRVIAVNSVGDSTASTEGSGTPRETTAPTVSSALVDGAALTVNFSEGLTEAPLPAVTTFAVTVGQNGRGVDSISISGSAVILTLASALTAGDQVKVSYTVPTDQAAARLKDLNENPAASFSDQVVTNNTTASQPALTASIRDEPTTHDGQAEFTFELRFSENVEGLSYATLRDHAFTVTAGEVKGARRLAPPSNTRWEIKILPTSNADVTIVLPITEDCTNQGAVCTQDGRKLSNQLEVVVPGPTPTQNSQAEGSPTISGTVQAGETLIVSTSGISDADGMTNATFVYQWLSSRDTEIPGATSSTYTLVETNEGKTIKVRVSFTDDGGNDEELTSVATAAVAARPNNPATGSPTISGTAQVSQTLTANTTGISDTDGLTNVSYSYQWLADDAEIDSATGSSYTLVSADAGKTIKVKVSFTDDVGNEESLSSAATAAVAAHPNTLATGSPTISGTAQVGQTLTANTTGISDADGLTNVSYSYQWVSSRDAEIQDATGANYTLVVADEGKTIKMKVSFTDDAGNEETLTSTATAAVVAGAPTDPPGQPRNLTGVANSDGTVTLYWDAPNDDSVTGYQILRRRPSEGESTLLVHVNDTESTATQYTDSAVTPDVLHAYRVKAINAVGLSSQSNFVNVTPVQRTEPAQNSPATGTPQISGTAQVGETLTASTSRIADSDGLNNAAFSYRWIRNDGSTDTDIQDATGSSYTLVSAAAGQTIKVEVTFTDDADNQETLTSVATAAVAPKPNSPATGALTISGTAQVGETLTSSTTGIADGDGLTSATFTYQWLADDADIAGATGSSYTLVDADEGKAVKVRVSFTDDGGNEESLTSEPTAAVAEAAATEPPPAPRNLTAVVNGDGHVVLSWEAPEDDSITGYQILRRRPTEGEDTLLVYVADTQSTATTYTDTNVTAGVQHAYRVKAINAAGAGPVSNFVNVTPPQR